MEPDHEKDVGHRQESGSGLASTEPPGKTAIEALQLMEDGRYRDVPIVESGKVVGIVSRFGFSGIELDRLDEETNLWEQI